MATTGILNGTLLAVYIGANKIDLQLQADLKLSMTPRESSTKDSGSFTDRFDGIRDWELSGEAEIANDATTGMATIFAAWLAGTQLSVVFKTNVSGDMILTGNAYVQEMGASAGVEENARVSYTFTGNGTLVKS